MIRRRLPPPVPDPLEERVRSLVAMTGGRCRYDLEVADEAQAERARAILRGIRSPGAELVGVVVRARGARR